MKNKSLLETTENTRDLGGHMTQSGKITKSYSLIRSDAPYSLSVSDIDFLDIHKITTAIDVRTEKTKNEKPSALSFIKFIDYNYIEINEGGLPTHKNDVASHYLNKIALNENMPSVFKTIANAKDGVIFHCTAGKDRTGVISAVLLTLAGVELSDILSDYTLTASMAQNRIETVFSMFPERDPNIFIPTEDKMKGFLEMLTEKFGNIENYLSYLGLSENDIQNIKKKLV